MRQRIKSTLVCSSENPKQTMRHHRRQLEAWHHSHISEIEAISQSIPIKQRFFMQCFDKLIEISESEALCIESYTTIIRK